jgi:hypothetical protein
MKDRQRNDVYRKHKRQTSKKERKKEKRRKERKLGREELMRIDEKEGIKKERHFPSPVL